MLFGEKLQKMRKLNGMSQEQLAEKLNVSRQAISKWEIGSLPDVENIIKISKYFNCSLDYLMNNDVDFEENHGVNENREFSVVIDKNLKRKSKIGLVMITVGFISIFILFVTWLISKIAPAPIVRQDYTSKVWYIGFLGFISYHNLFFVVYFCIFMFLSSISGLLFYLFYKAKKSSILMKRKSLIYAVCAYILILIAVFTWLYNFLNTKIIVWDLFSSTLVFGYLLCIFLTIFLSKYYWKIK